MSKPPSQFNPNSYSRQYRFANYIPNRRPRPFVRYRSLLVAQKAVAKAKWCGAIYCWESGGWRKIWAKDNSVEDVYCDNCVGVRLPIVKDTLFQVGSGAGWMGVARSVNCDKCGNRTDVESD